jgi:hypothetical protein
MQNVMERYILEVLVGNGQGGRYPQITGLNNTFGLSTRVHQGAATMGDADLAPGAGAGTDKPRRTFQRGIFDLLALGYRATGIIMNHYDYVDIAFTEDLDGRDLYTQAELDAIMGAQVAYDVRQPVGTALMGDFQRAVKLLIRRLLRMDMGYVNAQFIEDMITFRVTMRAGIMVKQPHAIIRLTGLA